VETPLWREPLWAVPAGIDLRPGSLVFTSDGELVGLVIAFGGRPAIVPAATLLAQAERLLASPPSPAGSLGIAVQDLTPALAAATGATAGVVVTWVAVEGPAREHLRVGDVIEAVDGRVVNGRVAWDVVAARLTTGSTLALRVRRGGSVHDVAVTSAPAAAPPSSTALGMTLRALPRRGAEVVAVERGASGDRAGLASADVITLVGGVATPTPRQVIRAFGSLRPGERMLIGVTRGDTHFVTTLERAR
jgi:S1-C subfamily serine protease